MIALVLALGVAALAGELPPPPPLLDAPPVEAPPAEEAPPVEEASPVEEAPPLEAAPPVEEAPPVLRPAPRAPVTDGPRAKPPPVVNEGFDPVLTGFLQWLVPCGTAVVAVPCAFVVGYTCWPGLLCIVCGLPAVNGYLAAYVGDHFGKERAPAMAPIVAAYAGLVAIGVAVTGAVFLSATQIGGGTTTAAAGLAAVAFAGAAASVAVPIAYSVTAEAKHAGDDGSSLPSWFGPGHPAPTKRKHLREPPDAPPRLTAMRF